MPHTFYDPFFIVLGVGLGGVACYMVCAIAYTFAQIMESLGREFYDWLQLRRKK